MVEVVMELIKQILQILIQHLWRKLVLKIQVEAVVVDIHLVVLLEIFKHQVLANGMVFQVDLEL
jgi:hypothetical protein